MTVENLIKMLNLFPPDAIVRVFDPNWNMMPITGVLTGPDEAGGPFYVDLESDQ